MKVKYKEIKNDNIVEVVQKLLEVIGNFDFDLIVYVAKSGYLIADILSVLTGVSYVGINSTREYVTEKDDSLIKLVNKLPRFMVKVLKKTERKLNFYDNNKERYLNYNKHFFKRFEPEKVLIIDDVIDTGYTIKKVVEEINNIYENPEIKVAVLSYFNDRDAEKPDFYLYENTVLSAPWTIDSKEYEAFVKRYKKNN